MSEIYTGPVIDPHIHVFTPFRLGGLMRWVHSFLPNHPVPEDVTGEDIVSDLEKNNVQYFCNLVYPLRPKETRKLNQFNCDFVKSVPNSAGWGSVHQENKEKETIVRTAIEEQGFIGIKLHPFVQKFDILEDRMKSVFETLNALRRPLFIHTGFDDFYSMKMPPSDVAKLAATYPDMEIVISHMFFPDLDGAFSLMKEFPQVTGDLTNIPGSIRITNTIPPKADTSGTPQGSILHDNLHRFSDRIIFGTDHPAGVGGVNNIHSDFNCLRLPVDLCGKILWDNPLALVNRYLPGKWNPASTNHTAQ